jgi:hypothetical protein
MIMPKISPLPRFIRASAAPARHRCAHRSPAMARRLQGAGASASPRYSTAPCRRHLPCSTSGPHRRRRPHRPAQASAITLIAISKPTGPRRSSR